LPYGYQGLPDPRSTTGEDRDCPDNFGDTIWLSMIQRVTNILQ
jgi:hypothetical protein